MGVAKIHEIMALKNNPKSDIFKVYHKVSKSQFRQYYQKASDLVTLLKDRIGGVALQLEKEKEIFF